MAFRVICVLFTTLRSTMQLGLGSKLVTLDIKDAYRIVPVHPDDYHLLGVKRRGSTYVDRALPFGLPSAPKIFNAICNLMPRVQ